MGAAVWTPERARQQRRRRWQRDLTAYAASCEHTGKRLREKVHAATADMIRERLQPNIMATLTFPASKKSADRRRWFAGNFLRTWLRRGQYVYTVEPHKSGLLHAHAVANEPGIRRLSMHDAWHVETGGFAFIEPVQDGEAATRHVTAYILKYITRGDQGELELGRNFGKGHQIAESVAMW